MKLTVHPLVDVHQTVEEVLPCVEDRDSGEQLHTGDDQPVDGLSDKELPSGEGGDDGVRSVKQLGGEERVVASSEGAGDERVARSRHVLGNRGGVESEQAENGGQGALGKADAGRPDGDVVLFATNGLLVVNNLEEDGHSDLDQLLDQDIASDLVARDVVALGDLLGGVKAVLGPDVVGVNEVEEH